MNHQIIAHFWGGWPLTWWFYYPRKLTWHCKITILNRRYFFNWLVFHCHGSSRGCIIYIQNTMWIIKSCFIFFGESWPRVWWWFLYISRWIGSTKKPTFSTGIRPLTYAAGNNHEEVCVTLIAGSADVRAQVGAEEVPGEEGNRLCL